MALDPTFNAYALAVAGASGAVAAGMHATSLAASDKPWPKRRVLVAQLIVTFLVGVATCEGLRALPFRLQLVPVLVLAGLVGYHLGPRGVAWYFLSGVSLLKRAVPLLDKIPDPPAPEVDPPTPALPEASPQEEGKDA